MEKTSSRCRNGAGTVTPITSRPIGDQSKIGMESRAATMNVPHVTHHLVHRHGAVMPAMTHRRLRRHRCVRGMITLMSFRRMTSMMNFGRCSRRSLITGRLNDVCWVVW
jgi:hypothetical protein